MTPILLIGPVRSGKSTQGRLLAEALGLPQASTDALRWDYYAEVGYGGRNALVPYPNVILLRLGLTP